jgi:bifunctional enzyme CysN/CysC
MARDIIGEEFVEIYVSTSLEECERRDVKGLYKKVRSGEIPQFTGITSPYEPPENPDIILDTEKLTLEEEIRIILDYIE